MILAFVQYRNRSTRRLTEQARRGAAGNARPHDSYVEPAIVRHDAAIYRNLKSAVSVQDAGEAAISKVTI